MGPDVKLTEKQLPRERRMNDCHSRLKCFEGSKRLKQMLFIESRKRETVWKALQLTRYVLLNMLSELNNKLQKLPLKHKIWLLHKQKPRLNRLLHKLYSSISIKRLIASRICLQA